MNNLKVWLNKAKTGHFALGAFNADTFETMKAVAKAAAVKKSPVILEISAGEEKFLGMQNVLAVKNNLAKEYQIPIFLNLDHADDLDTILNAIELGFDLVHFDGGKLPLEENIRIAKEVVDSAHGKEVLVEGEIDHFPGSSELHNEEKASDFTKIFTDPEKAAQFVKETGVDIFAAFIGNMHGVYNEEVRLDLDRLEKITAAVPETFLSLHGGSGTYQDDVKRAIAAGIGKVNINTELRLKYRETLENVLKGNPDEVKMDKIFTPVIEAVEGVVEDKIDLLGSTGLV